MNRLTKEKRIAVLKALCEGCSIRATGRLTGVSKTTIMKLLLNIGHACLAWEDAKLRNLSCERLQADEVWGFVGAKDKNVSPEDKGEKGSVWTWVCIDADTKLIVSWLMGARDEGHAHAFMQDVASRLDGTRPQLTTDALGLYAGAVWEAFRTGVDYAQVHKIYGKDRPDAARYSPAACIGCERHAIYGHPLPADATTSHVERSNLTLRMHQRRWTRLTNAFSKSFTHMEAAFTLHAFYYNWVRKHATLGTTPAVRAGLATLPMTMDDLVAMLEAEEKAAIGTEGNKRGPYRPRNSN